MDSYATFHTNGGNTFTCERGLGRIARPQYGVPHLAVTHRQDLGFAFPVLQGSNSRRSQADAVTLRKMPNNEAINSTDPETIGANLSHHQRAVVEALQIHQDERYPLGDWYLGALRALHDARNPDRVAQAANSLREVVEKLSRVVPGPGAVISNYDHISQRRNILDRLRQAQQRYGAGWLGIKVDSGLAQTLDLAVTYFEKSEQPSRRQQQAIAISAFDPLDHRLVSRASGSRRKALLDLDRALNPFAHHERSDSNEFGRVLEAFEVLVFDLLAPITADDQTQMMEILDHFNGDQTDIERIFTLMERRGANTIFFFDHATDPAWMPMLVARGYFATPPNPETAQDGRIYHPGWPAMNYLLNVADAIPQPVLDVINDFPSVDNHATYAGILGIACKMPGKYSTQLLTRIVDHPDMDAGSILTLLPRVAAHWASENELAAGVRLAKLMLDLQPSVSTVGQTDWHSTWSYSHAIDNGVIPLIDVDPFATAVCWPTPWSEL